MDPTNNILHNIFVKYFFNEKDGINKCKVHILDNIPHTTAKILYIYAICGSPPILNKTYEYGITDK